MDYFFDMLLRKRTLREYGIFLFLTGIFFLPSSLFIGILFLLPSGVIGSFLQDKPFFKDIWNYPFIIFGILIFISSLFHNFVLVNNYGEIWDPILSIVGMGNWIPFIWFFWALQPFINLQDTRKLFAIFLIAGSLPVLVTGFGQYFFNWHGPFETLNGLIIWYQRPIEFPGGLSGLFNNQNYAGSWLNFIWPFCLALFLETKGNNIKKVFTFGFLISIGFAAFLTFSRNAWIGLITSLTILLEKRSKKFIFFSSITFFLLLIILNEEMQNLLKIFIPDKILLEFTDEGYIGLNVTRSEIFNSAINLIKEQFIFGTGAASFSEIFKLETGFWKGHSHNLLLELGVSYGLPAALIFFITITYIVVSSFKNIFLIGGNYSSSIVDKAFWASLFFFLLSQLADIQYFDGKISLVAWILIAGLKNIINVSNKNNKFKNVFRH